MGRNPKKSINNRRGRASKPNLAVVVLILIVIIQAFFLFRAYSPKYRTTAKKHSVTTTKIPKKTAAVVPTPPKPEEPLPLPPSPPGKKGNIIIIVDDSGYKKMDCDHLADIDVPVTISILPELPYSKTIAECANAQGKEVMLHMPLEPHVLREKYPVDYFIKTNMSSTQITSRFVEALSNVPHVSGVNNHEGSKATEDSRVMYLIFKELAKKKLFFVDSRVTSKSVCKHLAEKLSLPFARRDTFLDNINERAAIEKQYAELAQKASANGTAIAIGHARDLSWTILKEQVKKLKAQGYEFITVQQLINSKSR